MKYIYFILITFLGSILSCDKEEYAVNYFENTSKASVCFNMECLNQVCTEIPADGATQVHITSYIPANTIEDKNLITFTSQKGTFLNSGTSTSKGKAFYEEGYLSCAGDERSSRHLVLRDTLISGLDTGKFFITMQIERYKEVRPFNFTLAKVEKIEVSSNKFALINSSLSEATITVKAKRAVGRPSIGQYIEFKILLDDGTSITDEWKFRNTSHRINVNSEASTTFTVGDIDFTGPIYCIACLDKVEMGSICDTLQMVVRKE